MQNNTEPVVVRNDRILGGRPTFRDTRVQAEILFENLAEGYSLDDIIENFPTLDRDDLRAAIMQACGLIMDAAPNVTRERSAEMAAHARLP